MFYRNRKQRITQRNILNNVQITIAKRFYTWFIILGPRQRSLNRLPHNMKSHVSVNSFPNSLRLHCFNTIALIESLSSPLLLYRCLSNSNCKSPSYSFCSHLFLLLQLSQGTNPPAVRFWLITNKVFKLQLSQYLHNVLFRQKNKKNDKTQKCRITYKIRCKKSHENNMESKYNHNHIYTRIANKWL